MWTSFLCTFVRPQQAQPPANKGTYSQVGFSYGGNGKEALFDAEEDDDDDDDDGDEEEDFDSNDSEDEGMEAIAKQFGVKRYGWLVYMDKKAKEEEKRQKELIKGDPSVVSCEAHFWFVKVVPYFCLAYLTDGERGWNQNSWKCRRS